ncbi:MAG: hypothetical protein J5506_05055 [Prevotella sp.]|nr:hypothetical protein [Prevotella sp.]
MYVSAIAIVKLRRKWAETRGLDFNPDDLCVPGTHGRILANSADYVCFRTKVGG